MSDYREVTIEPMSVAPTDLDVGGALARAEIDTAIATAKKYPRSVDKALKETLSLATRSETVATGCHYAVPRAGKSIEGPSIRFAELLRSCWGNIRAAARIIEEGQEHVVAQGVCIDLEKNVSVSLEIRRRIVDKHGKRFAADMIATTANAAASIALRNAILGVIPKPLWSEIYDEVMRVAKGDERTFLERRDAAVEAFKTLGVPVEKILQRFELKGLDDMTQDHLLVLKTLYLSIRNNEATISQCFPEPQATAPNQETALAESLKAKREAKEAK